MRTGCKGCTEDVKLTMEQIARMVSKLDRFPETCAEEEVYATRLAACRACPSLQYGTTCAHCGCIVQLRAKLRDKTCPAPGGSRWVGDRLEANRIASEAQKEPRGCTPRG
ncbi:DUF6171 family protein [Cohnella sp. REN36]|uniref:DUF6171 family protein n=1 Tax=Cohnella sp. REN36 TaxID=2887347 RepID=UPI001D1456CD|nr:DUF6171 family protein [Cohnella sp. REN36]